MKWLDRLGPLTKAIGKISGGVAVGQMVSFLAYPLLTRIFSDTDFGVLGVYSAIVAIVVTVSALRFDQAIPLPRDEARASALLVLSLIVTAAASLLSLATLLLFPQVLRLFSDSDMPDGLSLLVPIGVLLGGSFQAANMWAVRDKKYSAIAKTNMTRAVGTAGAQVAAGLAGLGPLGLVAGQALGSGVGTGTLLGRTFPLSTVRKLRLTDIREAASRYKKFALLGAPAALLNTTAVNLPPLLIGRLFSLSVVGLFSLTTKVLAVPVQLVGSAMTQVFYGEASRLSKSNPAELSRLVDRFVKRTLFLALAPALLLLFWAPDLFGFVFGESWRTAGEFAQPMSLYLVAQLVSAPVSGTFLVLERQGISVWLNALKLLLAFSSFAVPFWFGADPHTAIAVYSAAMATYYLTVVITVRLVLRSEIRRGAVKSRPRMLGPLARGYHVWTAPAQHETEKVEIRGYSIRQLSEEDLGDVEEARPSYGRTAAAYLRDGHAGFGAFGDTGLVALAWMYVNTTPQPQRVKGYFDVAPGEAYLHAAWTHPDHRRRGLQGALIDARICLAGGTDGVSTLAANIEPGLVASEASYRRRGFTQTSVVRAVSWLGRTLWAKRIPLKKGSSL